MVIKVVLIWKKVSPLGRASPFCRDPASQLNSLSKFIFVHMKAGPAFLGGISLLTTRDLAYKRAGNLPYINALKRASKSKL